MKKRFLFIFTLVFALNTISLSVLAAPCPHTQDAVVQKGQADLPPCHKKMQEQQSKQGHCKGICFCLHAQLSHNILPFDVTTLGTVFETLPLTVSVEPYTYFLTVAPPLKPPTAIS
jgi:hypothetical protein